GFEADAAQRVRVSPRISAEMRGGTPSHRPGVVWSLLVCPAAVGHDPRPARKPPTISCPRLLPVRVRPDTQHGTHETHLSGGRRARAAGGASASLVRAARLA